MTTSSELRVYYWHCIGPDRRYCARGMRRFARRHNLDLRSFMRQGIPANALEATGDAMALRAVENARRAAGVV